MKLRIKHKDIIATGFFHLGPNPDQTENAVQNRGWMIYPEQKEGMIEVMIVRIDDKKWYYLG